MVAAGRIVTGRRDVRKYKRKHARNPDRRMAAAVRLRAQGMSLRQIGAELACSEGTVRNDLARWARERPNVAALVRKTIAQNSPPGAEITHPDYAPDNNIVELRRKA